MRVGIALAALLSLAACNEVEGQQAESDAGATTDETAVADGSDEELVLTADGYGRLRIGMTRDEVIAAMGGYDSDEGSGLLEPELCDEFHPARAPEGLYVMIEQGVLTRITLVDTRDIGTPYGILVGDPASKVREAYGDRVDAMPHHYLGLPAEYLDVWEGDARPGPNGDPEGLRGIRYETNEEQNVEMIHAGDGSIQYVEGCL